MRKMRGALLLIMLFLSVNLLAQKKTDFRFKSYNSIGLMIGKAQNQFAAQTVNGVAYKKWFAGIGFGMDNYVKQTLPLFASLRRDFVIKKFQWFLYADAGGQFITNPNNHTEENFYKFETTGGIYLEGGAGIKIPVAKTKSIFFSFGNSFKKFTETSSFTQPEYPSENKITHSLSRLSLRVGYQF